MSLLRLAVVFTPLAFLAGCASAVSDSLISHPAPDFSLTTLDGRSFTLSQYKGKVVVLDFWATWCPTCKDELPQLQSISGDPNKPGKDTVVIAVDEQEKPEVVAPFVQQGKYTFTVVLDTDGSVGRQYGAGSLPTTLVIGRDGNVRSVINAGPSYSGRDLDQAVQDALQGS